MTLAVVLSPICSAVVLSPICRTASNISRLVWLNCSFVMALVCTYLPIYLSNCRTKNRLGSPLLFLAFLSSRITSFSAVGLIFSLFMLQPETNADLLMESKFFVWHLSQIDKIVYSRCAYIVFHLASEQVFMKENTSYSIVELHH